ncbi:MAG: hypothetical protein LBC75_01490 [Fibromonadaceae bacterium]|nr:hypothetical protein [Fibromonadaceae bacterium]
MFWRGDLDYDVKNSDYTYCERQVSYFSKEAYEEMQKRAEEGLLLLAKWLQWMWI